MIDYKSTSGSDTLIERVPSANLDGPISLTWLWEIIVRTKRLPDDLDTKVLFIVFRDRLRNPEREVRQHALRVLADLIPVIEQNHVDKHMELVLPDLITNLSHVAPAVRKSTIDVLRIYLKHTSHPNEVLRKVMTAVPEDSHLMQGLLMAVPYFSNYYQISEDTLVFLLRQLFLGIAQEFLRETALCSLIKTRSKLGIERFNNLVGPEKLKEFQELCNEQQVHLESKDDNVILETEITLETGPAITMQIHEETTSASTSNNFSDYNEEMRHETQTTDSESELVTRSPRKVHFGGEVVKMRTPESDSNNHSSDDNDIQTSVIIDRPTSIRITVSDNVAAIKTRHKSMIPVRITTGGSNPPTPRKKVKPKRLHKSAPELGRIQASKIPLPQNGKVESKKSKEQGEKVSKVRRRSRGEDQFSPIPVHNEIEVFHNLTRSPERVKEKAENKKVTSSTETSADKNPTYASFQVYKDDVNEKSSSENKPSPVDVIVHDLIHKEDVWTKSRALDDLIILIRKNNVDWISIPSSQLLQALFQCEKQPRLQSRAQEALKLVISGISLQTLHEFFNELCNDVIKIKPPPGVQLSLLVMQRSSPKQFFDNLNVEPSTRESMLQAMIAAARTFPSSEIDLIKGIHLAFDAMKDNKRAVRQAALETLASLAQVAGNTMILEAIYALSRNMDDSTQLVTVVRTRLSRRQLPTVDLDGNVRYSSPREQEEFDWLCGGIPSISKTSSLNTIKVSSNNNNNNNNNNYWKRNLKHDIDSGVIKSPSQGNESSNDEPNNGNKEPIWAIDASTFPKIENPSIEKATLCPVYVLHHETSQSNGRNYRNFDRGRSNSPPQRRRNVEPQEISEEASIRSKRFYRQNEQFRKSFSSEHIYNGNVKHYEPTSVSLSSRSSTTSTGSSTRSGLWLREFRSGIPVPINADSKLKFRSNRHSSDAATGPLIAQEPMNRTKLESPQGTPTIRSSPQQVFTQLPPPSSGSESSGYFTPPAEHHLKDQALERFVQDEPYEENNNFSIEEPNFQVVDSEASETHDPDILRQSSASSVELTGRLEEANSEEIITQPENHEEEKSFSPLDEVDFNENTRIFTEPRSKSRSEVNLKTTLPEITERKNINSAPPLNDVVSIVPYNFTNAPEISPVKTSLPGSVASSENTPTKKSSGHSPRRLLRRSISIRTPSLKRISNKSPKTVEVRPVSRPKEILNQGLTQMESCDWETVMQGLNTLIRLAPNHPEVLEMQMHAVCVALAKNIKNLRSQVARTACHAASEIFSSCKRGLDNELDELAVPLLQRTADTNKFLRSDANAALDAMSLNLSIPKVVAVVASKGSTHQNCVVRAAATRLLTDIAMRIGPEKVFQLPKETRDRFLLVGANGLTEGSLETRRHAKALMATLVAHHQFQKALLEAVPQHTLRHITKAINSLK